MTAIPDRDRKDILAAVEAKRLKMMRGATVARAEGNTSVEDYYLAKAGKLQEWIDALLARPVAQQPEPVGSGSV